jgi:hypothetical protein
MCLFLPFFYFPARAVLSRRTSYEDASRSSCFINEQNAVRLLIVVNFSTIFSLNGIDRFCDGLNKIRRTLTGTLAN